LRENVFSLHSGPPSMNSVFSDNDPLSCFRLSPHFLNYYSPGWGPQGSPLSPFLSFFYSSRHTRNLAGGPFTRSASRFFFIFQGGFLLPAFDAALIVNMPFPPTFRMRFAALLTVLDVLPSFPLLSLCPCADPGLCTSTWISPTCPQTGTLSYFFKKILFPLFLIEIDLFFFFFFFPRRPFMSPMLQVTGDETPAIAPR